MTEILATKLANYITVTIHLVMNIQYICMYITIALSLALYVGKSLGCLVNCKLAHWYTKQTALWGVKCVRLLEVTITQLYIYIYATKVIMWPWLRVDRYLYTASGTLYNSIIITTYNTIRNCNLTIYVAMLLVPFMY